jgi:putative oxidoreductase
LGAPLGHAFRHRRERGDERDCNHMDAQIHEGNATAIAAHELLGMTFVIQVFVYPANWAEHLTWASLLGLILTRGAGALSIDHWLARRFLPGGR